MMHHAKDGRLNNCTGWLAALNDGPHPAHTHTHIERAPHSHAGLWCPRCLGPPQGANLKPYLPHIGLLKTEREFAVPREDFCRELSKGSTLSFLKQLGADTVKVLQQMLHHGVSSEDTASILYNETATGHTLEAVAQLVGALADVDAAPLAYMLQVDTAVHSCPCRPLSSRTGLSTCACVCPGCVRCAGSVSERMGVFVGGCGF
jgi:hypothetical protein